jgi:exopolysaccharide production protein ExoZ
MKRIESLDYLRGLMALSVMVFHYSRRTFGQMGSDTLIGRLGIYAVAVFYILSGLSLTLVYAGRIKHSSDIVAFFAKRFFRIAPLFWLTISISILHSYLLSRKGLPFDVTAWSAFLNYSLLFGFIDPAAYLSPGAWSIGNELVFYSVMPLLLLASSWSKRAFPTAIALTFAMGGYFSCCILSPSESLSDQWPEYINPGNQAFFFASGIAIGTWGQQLAIARPLLWIISISACLGFVIWPTGREEINIVTGMNRWIFASCGILLVWSLYSLNPKLPGWPHRLLSFIGQGCYSIYLLHLFVASLVIYATSRIGMSNGVGYFLSVFVTLGVSWLTFRYIEFPMMKLGKQLSDKWRSRLSAQSNKTSPIPSKPTSDN